MNNLKKSLAFSCLVFSEKLKVHKYIEAPFLKKLSYYSIHLIFITIILLSLPESKAQTGPVKSNSYTTEPLLVGHKVPKYFWTKEYLFYSNGDTIRKSLNEYQGKLIILDLWATWCGSCISMFNKTEKLQEQFGEQIKFISVNVDSINDTYDKIHRLFTYDSRFTNSQNESIFMDSYLVNLFPYASIPRFIWIDYNGIVKAITTNVFITQEQIESLVKIQIAYLNKRREK